MCSQKRRVEGDGKLMEDGSLLMLLCGGEE